LRHLRVKPLSKDDVYSKSSFPTLFNNQLFVIIK
jgi:hypothetical protein